MTKYRTGDIVAVEFPFSDLQGRKRRPGLVLAGDGQDLLLARITTHPPRDRTDVPLAHWAAGSLPMASTVRLTKLATVDTRLVHHVIGHLHADDTAAIAQAIQLLAAGIIEGLNKT